MLRVALIFFIAAIIAGAFGFGGMAMAFSEIARLFFFVFVVLFILALVFGVRNRGNGPPPI